METMHCDVLVVGGGAAGCRAALAAKQTDSSLNVLMAVSGKLGVGGSTSMVASEALGINAPLNLMGDGDSPDVYYEDILRTGGGLSDPVLCRVIADESSERIRELMSYGLHFHSDDQGRPIQQKLSGCTKARSLTCGGSTGREMIRVLWEQARRNDVRLLENVDIFRLLRDAGGTICGAQGTRDGVEIMISAGAVVLATGGAGSIFRTNVTPNTQTGDGWAMAYESGCRFVNMEFFQIGPAIATASGMKFIIHSHMWRLLPKLTNSEGREFLADYCAGGVTPQEALDLKAMSYPFSVRTDAKYVDIAIFEEIMAGRGTPYGGVWFDVTHAGEAELRDKQPITYETLRKAGIDLAKEKLELTMAVQNFNGGIYIDGCGYTGVKGLYAAGEVTGGVHGSDRPGGNNLADTQVFGYRAGKAVAEYVSSLTVRGMPVNAEPVRSMSEADHALMREIAGRYYENLTVVREKNALENTLDYIAEQMDRKPSPQVRNRLLVGKLLAEAELARTESRGTHYRSDFPETDPAWAHRIVFRKGPNGQIERR